MPDDVVSLFPPGSQVDAEGELRVGGVRLSDIAREFGTPAYVVDEDALRAQAALFRTALTARWPRSRVAFASKAFPCTAAYRLVAEEGLSVDVAGGGELTMALAAGVDPAKIILHGNAKTEDELRLAVDAGVGIVVVDNSDDIDRLEQLVQGEQTVLVRVIPGVEADTHEAVATGHEGSKFGLSAADATAAIARLQASDRLRLAGVHMHIGSQILDPAPYREAIAQLAQFGEFDVYDVGGGLGARYTYSDSPPSVQAWLDVVVAAARDFLPASAELIIEPGRSLVARAGLTLYRVVTVKPGERRLVAVDGGMGDNLEVSLYGQRFEATLVSRVGGGSPVDLVGRHCESGDLLSRAVPMREPAVGDLVAVPVTGAYCFTMSNNYNGARRPPGVFVRDGRPRLVVRRETYEDLLRRDC